MSWSTPDDLEAQVKRLWDRGQLVADGCAGAPTFPLALRLRRPGSREIVDQFDDVRKWIRSLEEGSKPRRGFGYEIEWVEIDHRQVGYQQVPGGISLPTREDALRLIGRHRHAERFARLATLTLSTCPELREWLTRKALVVLDNAEHWEQILAVLGWFRAHPRPGVYLRQVDIPGVDTKFIEARRALMIELLDLVLPADAVAPPAGRDFEARYGLLSKPPLVRFRVLDGRLGVGGLSDVATPAAQFARLDLPVRRVFLTENEINGLALPELPDALAVFGLGYGLERLAAVEWLHRKEIHYWGDIDTHGFAILDRLRAMFPRARSLLMDRETLLAHRSMWVREPSRHAAPLARLTSEERTLFEDLVENRLGEHVRLEQERVPFGWVKRALASIVSGTSDSK